MKIGLCQTEILWQDKDANFCRAERLVEKGRAEGASLLLFPEMSFTGFSMNTAVTGETDQRTVTRMQKLASDSRTAIGFGWVRKAAEKAENHYTVVDETGKICSDYVKIHPFSYSGEDRFFQGGCELSSFLLQGHRIGTLICYDLRFPEVFQKLADTCDVITVAANWPEKRREHWMALLRARAIETQTYLCGINCSGSQQGLAYSGDSAAFGPDGQLLAGFGRGETILYVPIENAVPKCREAFPVRQDRRKELYRSYYTEDL
ncbi:MAG: nitrilase-related carbon-nitrogen hydrolase [Candidatus Limivivens sp.]|nr:nitrilase-related carbon-nitrogen hydrolase [Candidatus Limivivens sp.]